MKSLKSALFVLIVALTFNSCIDNDSGFVNKYYKDGDLMENTLNINPEGPQEYTLEFPTYYGRTGFFNKDDATLGRVIFYDTKLSADGTISCASCHKQELAFSDDKALSDGIFDNVTARNSLALGAVFNFQEYYGPNRVPFFWDNAVQTVEEQIVRTFGNKQEMDMTMAQIVDVINDNDYYKPLVYAANNRNNNITEEVAIRALATFVNSIGSYNSPFDQALEKATNGNSIFGVPNAVYANFADFTASENRGKTMYMANCSTCHGEVMGAPNELQANNGLRILDDDYGIPFSEGEFKVPSLRNLSLTYPYMHDGRFATIEEVVEHYSTGLENTPSIHPFLKDGSSAKKFNFTDQEKTDLISFLKTFDDEDILTDVRFSDPFMK